MTRTRITNLTIVAAILLFVLACLGFVVPLHGIFLLGFGWILFLRRVIPEVDTDWSSAVTGAIALALLIVGLHLFLRWLNAAIAAPSASDSAAAAGDSISPPRPWRLRWTASIVAIVVMMFVAGVSMVGIIHEASWLATAKDSIVSSGPRQAMWRMQSSNNLHNIVIAMHNYHDTYGVLPETTVSEDGQALSGWQTAILSFHYAEHYKQIDTSQVWDSQRNIEALNRPVPIYQIPHPKLPTKNSAGYALSHYAGNVHVLGGKKRLGLKEISDGASNTLLIGEAAGNYRPWGHPHNYRDPMIGINKSPSGFGSPWPTGAVFSFADGHTKFISDDIDPQVLRALATPAGGETVGGY